MGAKDNADNFHAATLPGPRRVSRKDLTTHRTGLNGCGMDLKPSRVEIVALMTYLGSIKSEKKAKASRRNGKLGGRPRKRAITK
jgi:hypothetical protein